MKREINFLVFGICLVACLATAKSAEAAGLGLVKVNQTAAKGLCLPDREETVESVLRKNQILLFTGNNKKPSKDNKTGVSNRQSLSYEDGRAKGVANVIHAVDHMGQGKFEAHKGARFVFGNPGKSSTNSRRTMYDIQLNPGNQNVMGVGTTQHGGTHNRALIAHELGHYVGRLLYAKYFASVKSKCSLTRYARENRNEEFAEVFAAYITNPALFSGKGKSCRAAFKFLAQEFGEEKINMSCDSRLQSLRNEKSTELKVSLRPVTRPRSDMKVKKEKFFDEGYFDTDELSFVLPKVEGVSFIEEEINYAGQTVDFPYLKYEKTPITKSEFIESYYRFVFAASPLIEFEEEEEDEFDSELIHGP